VRDLSAFLGLSRDPSGEDIRAAYWALSKQFHPDVNAGDKEAERRIKEINRAYGILDDPEARAAYNLILARARARARRSFRSAAATGAAAFILTVGSISVMVMWKQHADIHHSPSEEPGIPTTLAKGDWLVAKPPAAQSSVMLERLTSEEGRSAVSAEPSTTVPLEAGQPVPQAPHARSPARSKFANVTLKAGTTGIKKTPHRVCWLKHGYYRKCTWYRSLPYYYHHRYRHYD
jgi:curved DNA-binding protein CbpA